MALPHKILSFVIFNKINKFSFDKGTLNLLIISNKSLKFVIWNKDKYLSSSDFKSSFDLYLNSKKIFFAFSSNFGNISFSNLIKSLKFKSCVSSDSRSSFNFFLGSNSIGSNLN